MRKNLHWLFLTMIFMLCIAMAGVGTASPGSPVIRVEPKNNTAAVGATFDISLKVTDITQQESLYSWECQITFNPGILNAVNATEGPFLKDTGYETIWLTPGIDNAAGTIHVGALIMPSAEWGGFPPNGAVGSGTLATVTFKVVGQGSTDLEFKDSERMHLYGATELYTVITGENSPIYHTAERGSFSNSGLPIPLPFIAGIVVVVAVGAVAIFFFRRRRT